MSRSKRHAPPSSHSANQRAEYLGERPGRPVRWERRGKGWRHQMERYKRLRARLAPDWTPARPQKKRDGRKPRGKK